MSNDPWDFEKAKKTISSISSEKLTAIHEGGKDFEGALKRIVGTWSNPSHALIELIQNADDASAKVVECKFLETGILFSHDGHDFSEKEIRGISSIDASTKDIEINTGFMGVGFKSVYKVSDKPCVVNLPWKFYFTLSYSDEVKWGGILVPQWLESIDFLDDIQPNRTYIWLPYRNELSGSTRRHIEEDLIEKFDSVCLLFLRFVREIRVIAVEGSERVLKREGDLVMENKNGQTTRHNFLIRRNTFVVPDNVKGAEQVRSSHRDKVKKREIILAFSLDDDGNFISIEDAQLYTFLPTGQYTGLPFVVQGDFMLDTSRTHVDEGLEWNRWLWRCVRCLLQDAVEGYVDSNGRRFDGLKCDENTKYQFYRILPHQKSSNNDLMSTELVNPFWDWCLQSKIIITSSENWVKPTEAAWADPKIHQLVDDLTLRKTKEKIGFVNARVDRVKDYLKRLGVTEVDDNFLLELLKDEKWVNSRNMEWFGELYSFLASKLGDNKYRPGGWLLEESELRKLPIVKSSMDEVKLSSEILFPPDNPEELQLVTGLPSVSFVAGPFTKGESRKVLGSLGVEGYTLDAIARSVILKGYADNSWSNWQEEKRIRCVSFLKRWLGQLQSKKHDLESQLGAVRVKTSAGTWERADECYLPSEGIKTLLSDAKFVLLNDNDQGERQFYLTLGIKPYPRVLVDNDAYTFDDGPGFVKGWEEYWRWLDASGELRRSTRYRRILGVRTIQGWKSIDWNPDNAKILLTFLVDNWEDYYKSHLESRYEYYYYQAYWCSIPSCLAWMLRETSWIPTTKGMKKTSEVFVPTKKIKRVAGNLVALILTPSGKETESFIEKAGPLIKFLNLKTELDIASLRDLLSAAEQIEDQGELKKRLSEIYAELGRVLEDGPSELAEMRLLSDRGSFEESCNLFWNDDTDLGQYFNDSTTVKFAWSPRIDRKYLEIIFERTGVKRLSKLMQRKVVEPANPTTDQKTSSIIREKYGFIVSVLRHFNAKQWSLAEQNLRKVVVKTCDNLEIALNVGDSEILAPAMAYLDIETGILYLTDNHEELDIALELARAFGLPFDNIGELEAILRAHDVSEIQARMTRLDIPIIQQSSNDLEDSESVTLPEVATSPKDGNGNIGMDVASTKEVVEKEMGTISASTSALAPSQTAAQRLDTESHERSNTKPLERYPKTYEERMKQEAINLDNIKDFEARNNRSATDVSRSYLGYDLESRDNSSGALRYIEVKSKSFVELTQNEFEKASQLGESYYLYVVDSGQLNIIRDPVGRCKIHRIERVDTKLRVLDWNNPDVCEVHTILNSQS